MDQTWIKMYEAAKAVLNERRISEYVTCGDPVKIGKNLYGRVHRHLLNAWYLRGEKRDLQYDHQRRTVDRQGDLRF